MTNCTFTGNSATGEYGMGGGMFNESNEQDFSMSLTNCMFTGNSANYYGGVMLNYAFSPMVLNCTFTGNSAVEKGGGMFNLNNASPNVMSSIMWGNTAGTGLGIYNDDSQGACNTVVTYSCVQEDPNAPGVYPGTGNINANPQFVGSEVAGTCESVPAYDATTGQTVLTHTGVFAAYGSDGLVGMTLWLGSDPSPIIANDADTITVLGDASAAGLSYDVWDYHLQGTSPCIDAGCQ